MPRLLSQLVEDSAEKFSDRVAFRCIEQALTYEQLADQSNRIANFLIAEGVAKGDRVGIFLPRCLESAAAVYGVMKAGAAFVPIDPLTPEIRLRQILADCGVRLLICNPTKRHSIESLTSEATSVESVLGMELDDASSVRSLGWQTLEQVASTPASLSIGQDDLAYIMYTSGSTGRPKGIMHTHHSGLSYAELSAKTYDVQPNDVIGNHSPLHFDMSTFGYLTAPLAGATTSIIPAAYTKMPASLSQLIQDHRISIWYSVPFALIQLLLRGAIDKRDLTSLRWVLFGGEPFPPKHLRSLMHAWPHARFSNSYGPAEVNQCTYYHVPAVVPASKDPKPQQIPIGKVWERTEAIVLDDSDNAVTEANSEGELLIRSPTMMRGYWARPDLDAQVFYHPTPTRDNAFKFYRTGDIVRITDDGDFLFIGRKDRQIKLRGHRIELDDVEVALSSHPDVEEVGAYPIVHNGEVVEIGASILLVSQSQSAANVDKIVQFVTARIPAYAVPTRLEVCDVLPRTTSGKIDRRALQHTAQQKSIESTARNEI